MGTMTPRRNTAPALPTSDPRAADCSNCGGSGKVWLESDGDGPWKGKQLVDCPICRGSGKA